MDIYVVQEWPLRTGGLCVEVVFIDRFTVVQQWSLGTGGLYRQVHCSPTVVTWDRWSLCRGGLLIVEDPLYTHLQIFSHFKNIIQCTNDIL